MNKAKIVVGSLFLATGIYLTVHEGGLSMEHAQAQEHVLLGKLATKQESLKTVEDQLDTTNLDDTLLVLGGAVVTGFGLAYCIDGLSETQENTLEKA
jgi:hypothetical protein